MNAVIETIINRRSIRKYQETAIPRGDLETILRAGIYAPNGADAEPWHFTIITDRSVLAALEEKARDAMRDSGIERMVALANNAQYHIFFRAPVVVVISGEKILRKPGRHLSALADCSAAIQNMQLAAASLGIGSCWIGLVRYLFEKDESIAPEGYQPLFALTLGYSAGPDAVRPRKRSEDVFTWIEGP